MTTWTFRGIGVPVLLSVVPALVALTDERQPSDRVYEVIELTIGSSEPVYAPAPCEDCLDERAVLEAAVKYLWEVGLAYEAIRTEIWERFPWCGIDADEVVKHEIVGKFRRDTSIAEQFQDAVRYHVRRPPGKRDESCQSETWRVWYQAGRLGYEHIERMVELGTFPVDALAADVPIEKSFLIHARTGVITGVDYLKDPAQRERDSEARRLVANWTRDRMASLDGDVR